MSSSLSRFFKGVGIKRLSAVEVEADQSNQHEFNGIGDFKRIFGPEKKKFSAKFISLTDSEDQLRTETGNLTWYDARENHPTRSEFRLYYSTNEIMASTHAGDLVVIAQTGDSELAVIVAPGQSTAEKQLLWLFGLLDANTQFSVKDLTGEKQEIGFAGRYILSSLGFELEDQAPDYLIDMLSRFGKRFPSTREFSEFSRSTIKNVSPIEEPDETLLAWIEQEELLFKTLERVIVKEVLQGGFGKEGDDVDEFIRFSLSIQNRRKARAGFSLEHNLSLLFTLNNIRFAHGAVTERNNKPDFLFPGSSEYHDPSFDKKLLTMLGVKTTAKDRWRQVLSEAAFIPDKHLLTLEPSISRNQTEDMRANSLQLIIPAPLLTTYQENQRRHIITLKTFIEIVSYNQAQLP